MGIAVVLMQAGKKYRSRNGREYLCVTWEQQTLVENPSQFMKNNYSPLILLSGSEPVIGIQALALNSAAHEEYVEISE